MRNGLAFLAVVFAASSLSAGESAWMENYEQSLKFASGVSRPLLVVFDRSGTQLHPVSFVHDNEVESSKMELLEKYVVCRIDVDTEYGDRIAGAFEVSEFPHALIIDSKDKRILHQKKGKLSDREWTTMLTKFQGVEPAQDQSVEPARTRQPTAIYQPAQTQTFRFFRNTRSSRYCRT